MPAYTDHTSISPETPGFTARLRLAYDTIFNPEIDPDAPAQKKWEASVEGPMLIVSVVFLFLFVGAALGKTNARGTSLAEAGMWVTWSIFIIDYLVRLALAQQRSRWFWTHLYELIIVLLPWFRPLRVLRIVPILFLVQRFSAKNQRITVAIYTAVGSTLLILVASLSIYDAEYGQPGSHISSFQDAIWWAIVTVTTVGYGDIYPVTHMGRTIGMFLMVGGIAVAGIVTATVAAWLVQQVEEDSPSGDLQQNLMAEIIALREEIKHLRHDVEALSTGTTPPLAAEQPVPDTAPTPQPGPASHDEGKHRRHQAWSALKNYFRTIDTQQNYGSSATVSAGVPDASPTADPQDTPLEQLASTPVPELFPPSPSDDPKQAPKMSEKTDPSPDPK